MFCIMIYTYYKWRLLYIAQCRPCTKVFMFCAKIAVDCSEWASVFCIRLIFVWKNNTKFSPTMHGKKKKRSPRLSTDKWVYYYYCDFMAKYMSEWDLNYVNPFQLYDSTAQDCTVCTQYTSDTINENPL